MQYIRRNWFDIGTTLWAIGLLVAGVLWITTPAFAQVEQRGEEGEGDPNCGAACGHACSDNDGCDYYIPSPGGCDVFCEDGTHYWCPGG